MPQASAGVGNITTSHIQDATIIDDDISEEIVRVDTVDVSSAEILALHTTPKTLVAAPGAGKIIVVNEVVFSFDAGTQYANGEALEISYAGDTTDLVAAGLQSNMQGASDFVATQTPATGIVITAGINKALELKLIAATAYITGTGTLKLFVKYRILTL